MSSNQQHSLATHSAGTLTATVSIVVHQQPLPAALRLVLDGRQLLDNALRDIGKGNLVDTIGEVREVVKQACCADTDLALASIALCHEGRYSIAHAVSTAIICDRLARSIGYAEYELDALMNAALTMNASVMDIMDEYQSIGAPLTPAQRTLINNHPKSTFDLLRSTGVDDATWLEAVLYHHEAHDGTGYPLGRRGEDIPHLCRVMHIADLFCARVTARAYRPALAGAPALRGLLLDRGHGISANIAAHLIHIVGLYPPGTLVRLGNGDIGVVTHTSSHPGTPTVAVLQSSEGIPLRHPEFRDTGHSDFRIVDSLDPHQYPFHLRAFDLWPVV